VQALVKRLRDAKNAVIIYGAFVLSNPEAAEAVTALAKATGAKVMAVGPMANSYGLQALGVLPSHARYAYPEMLKGSARALILSGLNPAQDAAVRDTLAGLELLVVHDAFLTETATIAHVVLPAKTGYEKEGTTVNLEGRFLPVQAAPIDGGAAEDFMGVVRFLGEALGERMDGRSLKSSHRKLKRLISLELAEMPVEGMFPNLKPKVPPKETRRSGSGNLLLTPSMVRAEELHRNPHLQLAYGHLSLRLHSSVAAAHGLSEGDGVRFMVGTFERVARVALEPELPEGLMLLPALPDQPVGLYNLDLKDALKVDLRLPPPLPNENLPHTRLVGGDD
jgi:NADH-quinone oxidoreductase subunit G